MDVLMYRGTVILMTARYVKKIGLFVVCYVLAFYISSYGMPLHSMTSSIITHAHNIFGKYQQDIYEAGSDPVTFIALLVTIAVYAGIIYWIVRFLLKKLSIWK